MPRTKELSEDLRSRIVDLHKAGMGYKSISENLDLHVSTVRQTVYKWRKFQTVATLPRHGRPVKMTDGAQRRMLSEVERNPGASAKDLQNSLARANIFVDISTVRKAMHKNGVHMRMVRNRCSAARLKRVRDDVQQYWPNVVWTDEAEVSLQAKDDGVCGVKKEQDSDAETVGAEHRSPSRD